MRSATGIVVLVLGLLTAAARGDERDYERAWLIGVGANSCGQYLQSLEDERKVRPSGADQDTFYTFGFETYVNWAEGFLSGANLIDVAPRRMTGGGSDRAGRIIWLENFCRAD